MFMQLLYINEDTRIGKIKVDFNVQYPFLKIDFLKGSVHNKNRADELEKLNGENSAGNIDINKKRTVAELKRDFKEKYGLTAEVFRKSGNVWIETSLTEDWTLEQQNSEAELISRHTQKK